MMLICEEVMKHPLVTVSEQDDVGLAEDLLRQHGFRHLPVVRDGKLVGLLTQRDVVGRACWPRATPIGEAMIREVKTVRPGTPVRHAARIMRAHRISCLPVVDEQRKLLGLITESDLVELAGELAELMDRDDVEICRG
jgi:CBS domain-containing protein